MPRKVEPEDICLEVGASNAANVEKGNEKGKGVARVHPYSRIVPISEGVDIGRLIGKNGMNVRPLQHSQYGHVYIDADRRLVTVRASTQEGLERHFRRVLTLLGKVAR